MKQYIKSKYIFAGIVLFLMAIQINLLFSITEVAASDSYSPQNTDFAMSSSVDLTNLSIYKVDTNGNLTNSNVTAMSYVGTPVPGAKLLMYLPEAQVLSGSSPQAVLFTFDNLHTSTVQTLFNANMPVITSFSYRGYAHINSILDNHQVGPMAKIYSVNNLNSLQSIQQFSTLMAQRYSIMNLYSLNANFSQSDFNNAIGDQGTQSMKFTDTYMMDNANTSTYSNVTDNTFAGTIDPNFYSTYVQWNQSLQSGYITDQQINPNADKSQTQQTFFAGYNNFENDAIDTPVKDYAISALASQGIYLSANQLMVNYSSMTGVNTNNQMSPALRSHMLAPLNKTSSTNPYGLIHININFMGMKIFSVNKYDPTFVANAWGFTLPSINLANVATGAFNTAASAVSNTASQAVNLAKTAVTDPSSFVKDATSVATTALFHTPGVELLSAGANAVGNTLNWGGHVLSGAVNSIGKQIPNIAKAFNPMSWMGTILSTGLSFLKPLLPYIALAGGVIILGVLAYFLIYKKLMGKMIK